MRNAEPLDSSGFLRVIEKHDSPQSFALLHHVEAHQAEPH
jgi:hypothetical protein